MASYREPTNTTTVTFPIGLDQTIQVLQQDLSDSLSWLEYSFGRAYYGKDNQNRQGHRYPAVYTGSGQYQDVSPNDNLKSQSFFVVDGDYDYDEYEVNQQNKMSVPVSLILWGNLKKIAPAVDEHFGQVLLQDTLRVIGENTDFEILRIIDNEDDVFQEFSAENIPTELYYYPYFCYRIKMRANTTEECKQTIIEALANYGIVSTPPQDPESINNTLDTLLDFTL
jgi:hypothetical protein